MKYIKFLLSLSLLVFSLMTFGQKRLTNREIYNFDVGDEIRYVHYSEFTLKTMEYKWTIISRTFSANNSEVTYIILDSIYTLVAFPKYKLSIRVDTITFRNLDSFPTKEIDTSFNDACGSVMNYASYSKVDSLTPYTQFFSDRYYEGVGRFYKREIEFTTKYESTDLRFYRKGSKHCGQRIIFELVSVPNIPTDEKISLYPNPVKEVIGFSDSVSGFYQIFNVLGESINSGNFENLIRLPFDYPPGMYYLRISNLKQNFFFKFVVN